jgi:hypothetical protein
MHIKKFLFLTTTANTLRLIIAAGVLFFAGPSSSTETSSKSPMVASLEQTTPQTSHRTFKRELDKARLKRLELEGEISELLKVYPHILGKVTSRQSVAVSNDNLSVKFAGKRWFRSPNGRDMEIDVRLESSDPESVHFVEFDIAIYRKGSKQPIVPSSRWFSRSTLGFTQGRAVVRPLLRFSANPFLHPDLQGRSAQDIHLVIQPTYANTKSGVHYFDISRPDRQLATLNSELVAVESKIGSLVQRMR